MKTSPPPTRCPLSCQPSATTGHSASWPGALTASHTGQSGNMAVTKFFWLLKNMYFLNIMPTPHGIEAVFHSQHGHILKGYRTLGWGGEGTNSSSQVCIPVPLWVPSHTFCDGYPGELSLERSSWKGYPPTGQHGPFKVCTASLDLNFLFTLLKNGDKTSDAGQLHHTINLCHQ